MLLNPVEFLMMNNPLREAIQRRFEAPRLLRMGGAMRGGAALEIGCGRGVGTEIVLDVFGADTVDAFDLDPRMVTRARERLRRRGARARLWIGDATAIPAPSGRYDAVFDFGIVHHVPDWRRALAEVHRVLRPGGTFYAEEVLAAFVDAPVARFLLQHPLDDRFDADRFVDGLRSVGFEPVARETAWSLAGWFVARKIAA